VLLDLTNPQFGKGTTPTGRQGCDYDCMFSVLFVAASIVARPAKRSCSPSQKEMTQHYQSGEQDSVSHHFPAPQTSAPLGGSQGDRGGKQAAQGANWSGRKP
jgi:hypothetical protein